jgi:hypothetical protein
MKGTGESGKERRKKEENNKEGKEERGKVKARD